MLAKIALPSRTAATIVAKLSSASTMSAASRVTSVPVIPMATPMSAARSAGESFTPSPVMATMFPSACRASTMRSLCSGATRANTATSRTARVRASSSSPSISAPVSARAPAAPMPSSDAMRSGGAGMVPGDHHDPHPGALCLADRHPRLGPRRVDDADHPQVHELAFERLQRFERLVGRPRRRRGLDVGERPVGDRERAERQVGQPLDVGGDLRPAGVGQPLDLARRPARGCNGPAARRGRPSSRRRCGPPARRRPRACS